MNEETPKRTLKELTISPQELQIGDILPRRGTFAGFDKDKNHIIVQDAGNPEKKTPYPLAVIRDKLKINRFC